MRRREFIIGGLGSAAAWPITGRAQPAERMRRIGVLSSLDENDNEASPLGGGGATADGAVGRVRRPNRALLPRGEEVIQ
jgi:hypothetical protein